MIKLEISFDGQNYLGWQIQKDFTPTVQEKINLALKKIYKVDVGTTGSGRTDSGVHAFKLYATFKAPFDIPLVAITKVMNTYLPDDIRVMNAVNVNENFKPTNHATSREYRYFFTNLENKSAFFSKNIANISYKLDFEAMSKACNLFVGEHDFLSFHSKGSDPRTTTREIFSCEIYFEKGSMGGVLPDHYVIKFVGSGFLKQMVRALVGVIWSVGRGKLKLEDVQSELDSPTGKHIAPIAPAEGLYKFSVTYS